MKKLFLLILLFQFFISFSQEKNEMLSLTVNQQTQKEIIESIESKTSYRFFFIESWLTTERYTKTFNAVSLNEILNFIFKDTSINFHITEDAKVILTKGTLIRKSVYDTTTDSVKNVESNQPMLFTYKGEKLIVIGKESDKLQNTYKVSGLVINNLNKKPIEGVTVVEKEKNIYTTTNSKGYYSLNLPYGINQLETSFSGYNNESQRIIVYGNGNLDFSLNEKTEQLNEVTIDGKLNDNIKEAITGVSQLKVQEIKTIPLVLGERDILKVATTLPGIKSAGEGSEGINVRGGKVDQNLFLLDQGVIYNPTHFLGLFSAINPFTTSDLKIYKGNIPAEYGGRLSSVFDMKTKDASVDKFKGEVSIGPVTGNISLEVPIIKEKSGLLVGARSTYSDWVLKTTNNKKLENSSIAFSDFVTKYNHIINEKNTLKLTGYYSKDSYQIASDTINSYKNLTGSLNWQHTFNDKNIGNVILSNSNYSFNIDYNSKGNNNFNLHYEINETALKLKMKYLHSKQHTFRYGLDSKLYNISPGSVTPYDENSSVTPLSINKEKALESSLFISDDYTINKKLSLNLGLRFSIYGALGASEQRIYQENSPKNAASLVETRNYENNAIFKTYNGLEYRLSGRYFLSESLALKGGINKSFQFIHRLSNNTTASPIDTWRLSDTNIKPQESTQISLGLFKNINVSDYEISLESYYKQFKNIIDYKVGANLLLNKTIETEVLQGPGKSYGIEFLIKKNIGNFNGWLGYSYSRSFIKLDSEFAQEKVNNGVYFPSNYDKPHDLNLVVNYKLTKRFSLSSNFSYQTGRPITYPTGKYYYQGVEYLTYSERNKYRIPDYYRLDIGFNIEGNHKIKKFAHSFWNISIYNVLGRHNPYSIYFETVNGNVKGYKSSIFSVPIPTITYNFKF